MAKHYFEDLNEILGGDDFQQQSKKYIEQKEKDSEYYGYPYELTPFEADVGTVIYKRKMKLQPKSQPQTQPVKQMKKPKKGKGIIKVIAGVGAVVLCATIIHWIMNSEEIHENTKGPIFPISPYFSYGMNNNEHSDSNNFTR